MTEYIVPILVCLAVALLTWGLTARHYEAYIKRIYSTVEVPRILPPRPKVYEVTSEDEMAAAKVRRFLATGGAVGDKHDGVPQYRDPHPRNDKRKAHETTWDMGPSGEFHIAVKYKKDVQPCCKNCEYFRSLSNYEAPMYCTRHPKPVDVLEHHWCGEYKERQT